MSSARRRTSPDPADESPGRRRRTAASSRKPAHARGRARSQRFVAAATQLLQEKGTIDFTVQDVVDRSRMSIRAFYAHFKSKEDLLVALYAAVVAQGAVPRLRKRIAKASDPMLRLRAYIEGLVDLTTRTGQPVAARTLVKYQNRLAETRPDDLAAAMKPQLDLLVDLVADVARIRPLRRDLSVETAARLTHSTVLAAVHGRALGSATAADLSAQAIWEFCLSGMGVAAGEPGARSSRR